MASLLNLDLMRTLQHLKEEGSFTRAGERIGLTQQAVSAQVKKMESAIGRAVVLRKGPLVHLTADGEALLAYGTMALDISDRAARHFSTARMAGKVRIGVLEGFATLGLPVFLASLRDLQPDLELTLEAGHTDRLVARLDDGHLDVVLGAQRRGRDRGERLKDDRLAWFGNADAYRDASLTVRLALPPEPSLLRTAAFDALSAAGRSFAVVFESESRQGLRAAALCGIAMTVFCSFDERLAAEGGSDILPPLETIEYFIRSRRSPDTLVAAVTDLLKVAVRDVLS